MTHLRLSSVFLAMVLTAISNIAIASAQKPHTRPKLASQVSQPTPGDSDNEAKKGRPNAEGNTVSGIVNNLSQGLADDTTDPDDHVRCFFTLKQLMKLRPNAGVAKLTVADQSQVLTDVVHSIDTASENELNHEQKTEFLDLLADNLDGKLVGRTPGEALATIIDTLYKIQEKGRQLSDIAKDESLMRERAIADAGMSGDDCSNKVKNELDSNKSWFVPGDPAKTLVATGGLVQRVAQASNQSCKVNADQIKTQYDHASSATGDDTLSSTVANSARNAINQLAPPADIGCAYEILDWKSSSLLFGRSVADNYIGVQVTVRNLNPKEEFIVHNAMLSVDSDIHGAIGQFYEGVDKIGVEAFNKAGESLTPRGITGNAISAASAMLSTLQPIVNASNFGNAVAAFTGGVVPGWKTMSPDHQQDQLLLIANSGFSATYTTKTVVGKSGAATFYTWYPVKPLLQGWWLQDCAQSIATVGTTPDKDENPPELGVDKIRARAACSGVAIDRWRTTPYKRWSSISDQLFRDLSLAVVAGIHVREESKTKSTVSDLSCPKNSKGDIDLSKSLTDGSLNCDVTGDSLDKVAKLRLENASNAVDLTRPEAAVTVSGDNTSAKAVFKVSDLAAATASSYNIYTVGKDGTEAATGLSPLHLNSEDPSIGSIAPASVDIGSLPVTVTLTGLNLDQLGQICLSNGASKPVMVAIPTTKGTLRTQATLKLDAASAKNLIPGTWEIFGKDCSGANDSKQKLIVTGSRAAVFTPLSAAPGATVTITAPDFSGTPIVKFNGLQATVLETKDETIKVSVPTGATTGLIEVTTSAGYVAQSKDSFTATTKKTTQTIHKGAATHH